jgi:hypothetical protein
VRGARGARAENGALAEVWRRHPHRAVRSGCGDARTLGELGPIWVRSR